MVSPNDKSIMWFVCCFGCLSSPSSKHSKNSGLWCMVGVAVNTDDDNPFVVWSSISRRAILVKCFDGGDGDVIFAKIFDKIIVLTITPIVLISNDK